MVSNRVKEYDAECNMANNAMGSKATVTGSEPVYRNNKLKLWSLKIKAYLGAMISTLTPSIY